MPVVASWCTRSCPICNNCRPSLDLQKEKNTIPDGDVFAVVKSPILDHDLAIFEALYETLKFLKGPSAIRILIRGLK